MDEVVLIILVSFSVIANAQDGPISDEDYNLLPPIFHIDPYEECIQKKKLYCRLSLRLYPSNVTHPSPVWKLIQRLSRSSYFYDHDKLSHAVCLQENYNYTELKKNVEDSYKTEYRNKGLIAIVDHMNCGSYHYLPRTFDFVVLCFFVVYCALVMVATLSRGKLFQSQTMTKIIDCFSLETNCRKTFSTYHNSPFGQLKCIQTLRLHVTISIILFHVLMSFCVGYVSNTKFVEDLTQKIATRPLLFSYWFQVQSFFLLSGWLLSYNTFKTFQQAPEMNPYKYVVLTFFNRYLRLVPNMVVLVLGLTSIWPYKFLYGPLADMYASGQYRSCQRSSWTIPLFLSNHIHPKAICSTHLWYLSADTQLYVLSLFCLLAALKFPKLRIKIMGTMVVLGVGTHCIVSYVYNLDNVERSFLKNARKYTSTSFTDMMVVSYASFYSSMSTYMLGLIFGYICFRFENKKLILDKVSLVFWWIFSIGLIITTFILVCFTYGRITSAILSGIIKPLYALGVGIWILGLSHRAMGFLTTIYEWKPTVFLGTFTYSTYVFHFQLVLHKTMIASKPFELSEIVILNSSFQDLVLSFVLGIAMYFIFEMPFSRLQNMFVPKPRGKLKKMT